MTTRPLLAVLTFLFTILDGRAAMVVCLTS
jgi:hypothetical protein